MPAPKPERRVVYAGRRVVLGVTDKDKLLIS